MRSTQQGYIALIAVLITSAAAMAIATTLLITGTDAQRVNLITQRSIQARQLAHGCIEEALQKIHESTTFTGSSNVTLATGACSYTVTNTGGDNRTVSASSTIENVVRKVTVYVTISSSSVSVTSWQDVS